MVRPGKKLVRTPISMNELGVVVRAGHPSYMGVINKRTTVHAGPGINVRPYSKNNGSKKCWGWG
jgi:hypothetical protein